MVLGSLTSKTSNFVENRNYKTFTNSMFSCCRDKRKENLTCVHCNLQNCKNNIYTKICSKNALKSRKRNFSKSFYMGNYFCSQIRWYFVNLTEKFSYSVSHAISTSQKIRVVKVDTYFFIRNQPFLPSHFLPQRQTLKKSNTDSRITFKNTFIFQSFMLTENEWKINNTV